MQQGGDTATIYYAFIGKLDINKQSLLENIWVYKQASGGGSIPWIDMIAIF